MSPNGPEKRMLTNTDRRLRLSGRAEARSSAVEEHPELHEIDKGVAGSGEGDQLCQYNLGGKRRRFSQTKRGGTKGGTLRGKTEARIFGSAGGREERNNRATFPQDGKAKRNL